MAELLLVPEVAAGATEVVIAEWLVEVGQDFEAGDAVAVIETEKAVVEMEAESGATLLKSLVAAGAQVEVGTPMALLGTAAEVGADPDALLAELGFSGPAGAAGAAGTAATPAEPTRDEPAPVPGDAPAAPATAGSPPAERQFVSPIARKLLREAGLSSEGLTGSGPHGRVVRRDVEAAIQASRDQALAAPASAPATAAPAAAAKEPASRDASGSDYTEIPHTRLRRAVATRLTQSKQEIPHFYVKRTAVLDELLTLRAQLNEHAPVRISVNDFIIRAVAVALREVPEANVIWTDDAMRQFSSADISVAIASERGLVTPVLRGVEKSSLSAISSSVKTFVEQANAGRLQQKDLEGGSISVTNLGMFGVDEFSAIINPPQSAILAVGAGAPTVRVVDGEITTVTAVNLVLSVDHRAIDGALAAQWMACLVDVLENPLRLVV